MIPPNEEVNAINIKEVAKAAGVSVATISRVLNHPEQVQPETKTHVLAVMESLNYRPNWFARGLNLGKTSTIALLVPNIESRRYREILSGVETVALKSSISSCCAIPMPTPSRRPNTSNGGQPAGGWRHRGVLHAGAGAAHHPHRPRPAVGPHRAGHGGGVPEPLLYKL